MSAVVGETLIGPPTPVPTTKLPGYAPTYYPGTPSTSEAQMIAVGLSPDVLNVDFTLVQVPTARVSGAAFDSMGQPLRAEMHEDWSFQLAGLTGPRRFRLMRARAQAGRGRPSC